MSEDFKILCVFCNEEQSAEVCCELDAVHAGGDTCGYGSGAEMTVEIYCSSCGKLIYKKEFNE